MNERNVRFVRYFYGGVLTGFAIFMLLSAIRVLQQSAAF